MLKSLIKNGVVFTSNPYVHIGYRRVCLHIIHMDLVYCLAWGKFKFFFLELSGTFSLKHVDLRLIDSVNLKPTDTEG